MPYTTEQIQSLSAGYRQGFISAEEAVAMLRDAHDERTGELIVGEMFVVEAEHFDWSPLIPRRVIERHFYKSEVSASCHGWRKCESCGDWFNEEAIAWINAVLEQEGFDGRLYEFYDSWQSVILIYGSEEKADQLGQLLN